MKDEAEKSIRIALSLSDNDEHTYWGLGVVLGILRDKFEEAEAALQRAVEINPNFSLGYATGGQCWPTAGERGKAFPKLSMLFA